LKFADDTKLFGSVGTLEDIEQIRRDLERLFDWPETWQMKFNLAKCMVMHIGGKNSKARYVVEGKALSVITEEKDLDVITSNNFKVSKQCIKAASKGNQILGLINRAITCRNKRVIILNLYKSLVRPHLEHCVQAWRPHLKGH
jgi:ribonucleases P/MRP protein subunit RPP40